MSWHTLQIMHHGCTAVHWDSNTGSAALCHLRIENDSGTLTWTKPNWSALQGLAGQGILADYVFTQEEDGPLTHGITMRYQSRMSVQEENGEGHVDLKIVKEVLKGQSTCDLNFIAKKFSLENLSLEQNCVCLLYGSSISENRLLEFVLPGLTANIWFQGLSKLVEAQHYQRRKVCDRRLQWLKSKYLSLYFEDNKCQGPNPAEAIRVRK